VTCWRDRAWYTDCLVGATAACLILMGGSALGAIAGPPRVVDGAALEIAGQQVRLFGIAAPALDQLCQHGGQEYQCGRVARAALWDLVGGLDVSCEPAGAASAREGVIVATCRAGRIDLREAMVRSGWALADHAATNRYAALQAQAKQARRGLWRGTFSGALAVATGTRRRPGGQRHQRAVSRTCAIG
jgi:endonuclease YncB( thermonuclease family)